MRKAPAIALFIFVKIMTVPAMNLRRYSVPIGICVSRVKLVICFLNGRTGAAGSLDMHTLLARSALGRGMQLVAGMLNHKDTQDVRNNSRQAHASFQLVSWQPGAHSRREDELARRRQNPFG